MSIPIRIALILLIFILIGWPFALLNLFYFLVIPLAILTPVFTILGIIFSIRGARLHQQKVAGWILFSLHTIVFLFYAVALIYGLFFWNPRFF